MPGNLLQSYHDWSKNRFEPDATQQTNMKRQIGEFSQKPLISIVMPVWKVERYFLEAAISSVLNQIYSALELCIVDDASDDNEIEACLKEYALKDGRVRVLFSESHSGIVGASNQAAGMCRGDFIAFLDHDDLLTQDALFRVVEEINCCPDASLLYSDHDKVSSGGAYSDPLFKPDWDLELLLRSNYAAHLLVVRRELFDGAGGFRPGTDGAQDWDLLLRVSEMTSPRQIRHIPFILYHWRLLDESTAGAFDAKPYVSSAQQNTVREYFERNETVIPLISTSRMERSLKLRFPNPSNSPLVTMVFRIPDDPEEASSLIERIISRTDYDHMELILLCGDGGGGVAEGLSDSEIIRVVQRNKLNRSSELNSCVRESRGEFVVFLDENVQIHDSQWLNWLVGEASRSGVGIAGGYPYFSDGFIEWHPPLAQFEELSGGPACAFPERGVLDSLMSFSVEIPSCFIVRREIFDIVGGFNEDKFPVLFSEREFYLRVHRKGCRISASGFDDLFEASLLRTCRKGQPGWENLLNEIREMTQETRDVAGDALAFL